MKHDEHTPPNKPLFSGGRTLGGLNAQSPIGFHVLAYFWGY